MSHYFAMTGIKAVKSKPYREHFHSSDDWIVFWSDGVTDPMIDITQRRFYAEMLLRAVREFDDEWILKEREGLLSCEQCCEAIGMSLSRFRGQYVAYYESLKQSWAV